MSRMNRSQSTAEAQDPISHFEQIFSIQGENKTATVYKTSKGVIKFERSFIFWQYVSNLMPTAIKASCPWLATANAMPAQ